MNTLEAMIAGYIANKGTITVCPPGRKAYPHATEQDWKDAISRHHVALEIAGLVLKEEEDAILGENLVTGAEHSQVFAYYLSDDEDTSDVTDLDRAAYEAHMVELTDAGEIGDCWKDTYAQARTQLDRAAQCGPAKPVW